MKKTISALVICVFMSSIAVIAKNSKPKKPIPALVNFEKIKQRLKENHYNFCSPKQNILNNLQAEQGFYNTVEIMNDFGKWTKPNDAVADGLLFSLEGNEAHFKLGYTFDGTVGNFGLITFHGDPSSWKGKYPLQFTTPDEGATVDGIYLESTHEIGQRSERISNNATVFEVNASNIYHNGTSNFNGGSIFNGDINQPSNNNNTATFYNLTANRNVQFTYYPNTSPKAATTFLTTDATGKLVLKDISSLTSGYWQVHNNTTRTVNPIPTIFYNGTIAIGNSFAGNDQIFNNTPMNNTSDYRLVVAGTIGAKKVRVTESGWADYVFAPDYKLLPLTEVEKFIKANQHLPEVPSAKEVKANGVDLAETQVLLLKKVEELTLHLIEQNKKIEKLEKQLAEIKQ